MGEINIFTEFPPSLDRLSEIPASINLLYQLTDTLLKDKEKSQIVAIERKGRMLFTQYHISRKNTLHVLSNIELFHMIPESFISSNLEDINENLPIIILTDAIRKGKEIRVILDKFKNRNVTNVIGYLAKTKTIDSLTNEFPHIKFSFLEYALDDEEYKHKYDEFLRPFFLLILEPIELRPYNLYSFDNIEKILDIINNIVIDTFETDNLIFDSQKQLIPSLRSYSYDLVGESNIGKLIVGINGAISQYERISIRCKIDMANNRLSVVVYPHIHVNCEKLNHTKICQYVMKNKQCEKFKSKPLGDGPWTIICTHCIHQEIAIQILEKFDKNLFEVSKNSGISLKKINGF
ncbi:MAG: hypothetical protein PHI15_05750 [Methanomicrobium sp.]|nr:hypothetical protein [Methanomicrobium sp.]